MQTDQKYKMPLLFCLYVHIDKDPYVWGGISNNYCLQILNFENPLKIGK